MNKEERHHRYWFIELHLWWEGRINCPMLEAEFNITRQYASQVLRDYRTSFNPDSTYYDASAKVYRPKPDMRARLLSGDVAEYFNWVSVHRAPVQLNTGFATLEPPPRRVSPTIMRPLVRARREQRRLEVDYVSLTNPDREGRIIVPHSFVNTGLRWHLRAWCEKSEGYRDFVLSRFRGEPEVLDESPHGHSGDEAWNTEVTLVFVADTRLSPERQEVVQQDYQMEAGKLKVTTRAALAHYVLQEMQVNTKIVDASPEAQQLVLVNRNEIKPCLFSD